MWFCENLVSREIVKRPQCASSSQILSSQEALCRSVWVSCDSAWLWTHGAQLLCSFPIVPATRVSCVYFPPLWVTFPYLFPCLLLIRCRTLHFSLITVASAYSRFVWGVVKLLNNRFITSTLSLRFTGLSQSSLQMLHFRGTPFLLTLLQVWPSRLSGRNGHHFQPSSSYYLSVWKVRHQFPPLHRLTCTY